jgi:hypothetical protein
MSACPNYNDPAWKDLVAKYGKADAMTAFINNNYNVPTLGEADKIFKERSIKEVDEILSSASDEFKLERAKVQNTMLEKVSITSNTAQKATIQKLKEMNEKYQKFLQDNIDAINSGKLGQRTTSVSMFTGTSEFKGDPKEYEAFKLFGTFVHEVLEFAQTKAIVDNTTIDKVYTKEFFEEVYNNYTKKNPFTIENLSKDELYEMAMGLIVTVNESNKRGYKVVPEISVFGTTAAGTPIVGRLDLLLIDANGKIQIFDFKTKKVKKMYTWNPLTNKSELDVDSALFEMAMKENQIANVAFVGSNFRQIGSRSVYDNWLLQLGVYENMLIQNGIDMVEEKNKTIVSLLYQVDENTKEFKGSAMYIFDGEDYYDIVRNSHMNAQGQMWNDVARVDEHVLRLKIAVEKEIPTGKVIDDTIGGTKSIDDVYDVTPTEQNIKNFIENIEKLIDGQISKITEDIENAKSKIAENQNENYIKILETRRNSINQFKNIVEKLKTSNPSDILYATNFANALNIAEEDFNELLKISKEATEIYSDENSTASEKSKALAQVSEAYNKGILLKQIVDVLEEIVDEAAQAEGSEITATSPVRLKLSDLRLTSNIITANFKENVAMKNAIEILQSMSEKAVESVSKEVQANAKLQLENVKKKLFQLKNNPKLGIYTRLKFSLFSFTDADFKEKLKTALGPDGDIVLAQIQKLEALKLKLEAQAEGYDLSAESLEKYINGITDPGAALYPGMQNPLEGDTALSGWNVDSWIASAGNSDRLISSFTLFLKEHKAQAEHNVMTDAKIKNLVKIQSALIDRGFTLEQLNSFVSETRTVEYTDPKTGERMQKRIFDIAKPYSEEYENTYRNYSVRLKELNKEIYALKAEYNQKFKTAEKDIAEQALTDKKTERDDFNNEYIEWLLENASLPYSDKFYELQLKLPNEVREKIQKLYLEQEGILFDVGRGNEALLDEDDLSRLEEIDTEIRRLRLDAQEDNQDYAVYLEELNNLYEYELNDDAYKRAEKEALTRFSDDAERLKIWKKTNSITRPTSEWYEEVNALYEERAQLYGSDPEIQTLMDQKRKIMAPYKQNGRFNPKYLTEEEISEIDKIEAQIETVIEDNIKLAKSGGPADPMTRAKAREISEKLNRLVTSQLNPIYNEEFEQKYRVLKYDFNQMIDADSTLNAAKKNPSSTAEDIEQLEENVVLATMAFSKSEREFEYWYNQYHKDSYMSMTKVQDHTERRVPKNFNFERLPSTTLAAQYMETVPNPKYYKIKRLRIGNWTLDDKQLNNSEIKELQANPQEVEDLMLAGRLITKQGAINPDFLKSPDGIPMPKEIKRSVDGHYYVDPSARTTSNVNSKFADLMNNPDMFNLYNAITDLFFDLQQKTEGRKIGYQVPGFASSTIESMARLGLKEGFSQQYKAFLDKHLKAQSEQDASTNIYGDAGERIRMRFTNQLSEDIQSQDAIGSILKWATEAHMNIAMQEVAPKSKAFIQYLELQAEKLKEDSLKGDTYITNEKGERIKVDINKKVREIENLIEIVKFENNKHLYGIYETEENRSLKKFVDGFFKYTSFIRIGFDVANQIKNFTSGNLQSWLAAGGSDSDHYTRKDWLFAKGQVYGYQGFLANYFKDWGKVDDLSDSTLLYRTINPAQKDIIKYYSDIAGGKKRKLAEKAASVAELGYLLQDKGDTEIAVTVMYAVMNKNKYELLESIDPATGEKVFKRDEKGEIIMVPAHEAYVQDASGNLVIREDVNYDKKEENRLRNIINSEMRRAQGNYASVDQTKFESKTIGKMVFFFRKFLIPQFLNRFGYLRANWEGSEVAMGYWRATARAIKMFGMGNTAKEFFIGSKMMSKVGMNGGTKFFEIRDPNTNEVIGTDNVGDFYTKRIRHARHDAITMMALTLLAMSALAYVKRKDDDDEEIGIIEGNAIRILWGTKAETVSMFPIGEGSNEYVKNFTTAIPFMREATAAKNLVSHSLKYGIAMTMNGGEEPDPGYDSQFYQEIWKDAFYTRRYGAYEKGDAKVSKDIVDLTGIKNFRDLVNPEYKIDVLKGKQ